MWAWLGLLMGAACAFVLLLALVDWAVERVGRHLLARWREGDWP